MPVFSQSSKDKLIQAHTDFQILFNYVIQFYDCTIAESYRTKARQHQMLVEGKSKIDYPTVHNTKPSLAVDVYPYEGDHIDFSKTQSAYFAGFVMGAAAMLFRMGVMKHRIRCGIDWDKDNDVDDNDFWDAGHFELIPNPGEVFNNYFET
jgi:peptidoglycan LD-endopeptidase CwlK